jgi:chromosome segregation ATPase
LIGKEKENEKLLRTINDLKSNINDKNLVSRTDENNTKNEIQRLKEENRNLSKDLSEKEEQNISLIDNLNEANDIINKMNIEIEKRDNQINELMEEKEQLMIQLNERQNDFNEYQNSSERDIQMLNQKLLALEKERENLIFENEQQNNEINQLKEDLYQFEANGNIIFEEKKYNDNKINNMAQAFQIKEGELSEENEKLYKIIKKLEKENQNLQAKYEKRVNLLTLENNEASLRIRKLINTCITLKDYALNIERNMNNINLSNSMIIDNQKNRGYLQNNKIW